MDVAMELEEQAGAGEYFGLRIFLQGVFLSGLSSERYGN